MKEQQMMIPKSTFFDLVRYFLLDMRTDEDEAKIKKAMADKLEASIRHELYSKFKSAPTEQEREQARLEYLERAGIPEDFRYRS